MAGPTRATWASSTWTATCMYPAASRTSSFEAATTSVRTKSKTRCAATRASPTCAWWRGRTVIWVKQSMRSWLPAILSTSPACANTLRRSAWPGTSGRSPPSWWTRSPCRALARSIASCRDIDVAWVEWGRGDPLVLVHGLADDHRAWRKTLAWLALERRVIAYDLRGHGQTALGAPDGTLSQLAGDLVALLDALDLERPDLCGFSLGGTIVLRAAADHPQRVRRLLPVATSSRVGRVAAPWYEER